MVFTVAFTVWKQSEDKIAPLILGGKSNFAENRDQTNVAIRKQDIVSDTVEGMFHDWPGNGLDKSHELTRIQNCSGIKM